MAQPQLQDLYADDPIMSRQQAAQYLAVSLSTLRRLSLKRTRLAGTGLRMRFGYRRSVLNRYLSDRNGEHPQV
jgi:hypothetical protein